MENEPKFGPCAIVTTKVEIVETRIIQGYDKTEIFYKIRIAGSKSLVETMVVKEEDL